MVEVGREGEWEIRITNNEMADMSFWLRRQTALTCYTRPAGSRGGAIFTHSSWSILTDASSNVRPGIDWPTSQIKRNLWK